MRRRGSLLLFFLLTTLLSAATPTVAGSTELSTALITQMLGNSAGEQTLWLTPAIKENMRTATGKAARGARQQYWRAGARTLWVLEHIGKEMPITFAVTVENDRIVSLQVIAYRESRGHEIKSPRFLAQFAGVGARGRQLDQDIDGISGATLSVRASLAVARQALFLHQQATTTP